MYVLVIQQREADTGVGAGVRGRGGSLAKSERPCLKNEYNRGRHLTWNSGLHTGMYIPLHSEHTLKPVFNIFKNAGTHMC